MRNFLRVLKARFRVENKCNAPNVRRDKLSQFQPLAGSRGIDLMRSRLSVRCLPNLPWEVGMRDELQNWLQRLLPNSRKSPTSRKSNGVSGIPKKGRVFASRQPAKRSEDALSYYPWVASQAETRDQMFDRLAWVTLNKSFWTFTATGQPQWPRTAMPGLLKGTGDCPSLKNTGRNGSSCGSKRAISVICWLRAGFSEG